MRWYGMCAVGGTCRGFAVLFAAATLCVLVTVPGAVQAGERSGLEVRHTAYFDPAELSFDTVLGYDVVTLPDGTNDGAPGRPLLPTRTIRLALPRGMAATHVEVAALREAEIPGHFNILPSQPLRPVSRRAGADDFVGPLADAYALGAAYPEVVAELLGQCDLAGQAMALVRLHPLRYVPAEQRLAVYTAIELVVHGEPGYECGHFLPAAASSASRTRYAQRVAEMVANPEAVRLEVGSSLGSRELGPANYEYVIITQASWVDAFQPLADWKTKKGVPAIVVTREWIAQEYWGDNLVLKIRQFIRDAHSIWGAEYFLLGGDTNIVPCHVRVVDEDAIPNDTFYSDYDSDGVCEVHVGRAPARNSGAVATFVNKVLTYEKNPPLSDYATMATFLGFDLNTYGSGEGEGLKIAIQSMYLPAEWTCRTEYDSEPGEHWSDSVEYLNLGNNIVNHADHSSTNAMGVGSVNHHTYLYSSDMSGLSNGNRQSIMYSIGCYACDYESHTCVAEAFVRNAGGGGVAFIGNSRYGWYQPFSSSGASLLYDRYFFRSLFVKGYYRLGDSFSDHKQDGYAAGGSRSEYIFTELTLLGDPEMPIWTAEPQTFTVTHPETAEVNLFTDFPVQVFSGGDPVADAVVCVWKPDDVYEVAQTDESGTATFWFAPSSEGALHVTVSGHNYLPHETSADAFDGEGPYTLTVLIEGQGLVALDPPSGPYSSGAAVDMAAQAAEGWTFHYWTTGLTGFDNPDTVIMNRNKIVTAVFARDCNGNNIPDVCDVNCSAPGCDVYVNCGESLDCNRNGIPDECDIASGTSADCQPNGIPDECELAPPEYVEGRDDGALAEIVCPPGTYYGTTEAATSHGACSCADTADTPDIWYYYSPHGSGLLTIALCGSDFDTVLSVHSGFPGTPENELACNDDYCFEQSRLDVVVQNRMSYWIRVSGKAGATGVYQMTLTGPTCFYNEGDLDENGIPDECEDCGGQLLGDANCDGLVNSFDIDAFVLALTDPFAWAALYPECDLLCTCDINGDGFVNSFDIDPFVMLLTGS